MQGIKLSHIIIKNNNSINNCKVNMIEIFLTLRNGVTITIEELIIMCV